MDAFRSKASFDSFSMACFLQDGTGNVQKRRDAWHRVEMAIGCQDTFKLPSIYGEQNRSQQYEEGLEAGKAMLEDQLNYKHDLFYYQTWKYQLANALPFGQTTLIFIPCLKFLGSSKQAAMWIPKALRGEMFGSKSNAYRLYKQLLTSSSILSNGSRKRYPNLIYSIIKLVESDE